MKFKSLPPRAAWFGVGFPGAIPKPGQIDELRKAWKLLPSLNDFADALRQALVRPSPYLGLSLDSYHQPCTLQWRRLI